MNFIGKILNMNNTKQYDITLCTVACTKKEKYANRLKEYIDSYGFKLKNNNIKVKFVFLVEDEPRPNFIRKNDIWFNCPDIPFSMRWIKYLKETEIDSKWVMQVDDDSSTDLDKTIEILNQCYDADDSVMLMGGRNTDLESTQQRILRIMKAENFFYESEDITKFDGIPYFIHAWEPSIISKSGIKKIKNWNRLEEYYKLCKTHKPTFTDQAPYVLARLAKVPIAEATFLCPFEWASMYSGINKQGRYCHIHYVTEKWNYFNNFKIAMKENISFNNEEETKKYLTNGASSYKYENQEDLSNTMWKFLGNGKLYGMMRLNKDGSIGVYSNDNEKYWEFKDGSIHILNKDKQTTSILNKVNDTKFEGKFLLANDMIHKLVRN
jgi:hypothetical protein